MRAHSYFHARVSCVRRCVAHVGRNYPFGVCGVHCKSLPRFHLSFPRRFDEKETSPKNISFEKHVQDNSDIFTSGFESTSSVEVGRCSWQKVASRDSLERACRVVAFGER